MGRRGGKSLKDLKSPLSPQQELFCRSFVMDEEFLGNGTHSYAHAYNIPKEGNWFKKAAVGSSRLLKSVKISNRITELLNLVMNDATVDNELGYVITQKSDLSSKVAAIREYNKLKKRVSDLQINDVKVLVLPSTLIKKNDISISKPVSDTDTLAGNSSLGYPQVSSVKSRKKSRKDSVGVSGDSSESL